MAVYTALSQADVQRFIQRFGWHDLVELKATESGIENTNYFVTALDAKGNTGKLVLTLFENVPIDALPYFVELTSFLADKGIPVPKPFRDHQQLAVHRLKSKPALLVPCFAGHHPQTPSLIQCQLIATALAKMHLASGQFLLQRENVRGPQWRRRSIELLSPILDSENRQLLLEQTSKWTRHQAAIDALPHGITHNDLFHDNALFLENKLTGIIDFYQACNDVLIYDLAVLVNDWCSDEEGRLMGPLYDAVMGAYQQHRPFTPAERAMWPDTLAYAALRFWISRLLSWHDAESHRKVAQKDPDIMRRILLWRLNHPAPL